MIFTQKLSPVTWSYTIYGLKNKLNLVADPSLLTLIQSILLVTVIRYFFFFLIFINTPLLARIALIFITLLIRLLLSSISSKWISFILIMLFLGGMMVLFVYICTLITKIKVLLNNSVKIYVSFFFFTATTGLVVFFKKVEFSIVFSKILFSLIYQKSICMLLSYSIVYLLLILYVCVKIVQKHKGGLKSKFNV